MSRSKDIALGPIILLELDKLRILKVVLKVQNISYICTTPLIYALVIVPNHANISVSLRKQFHEPVLYIIRILILVHHYIFKSVAVLKKNALICLEHSQSVEQ